MTIQYHKPQDDRIEIRSDKQRILQIILNLVNNAIKFTRRGGVSIKYYRENDNIKIEVSDTGIGIKEEQMNRLFHPFVKVEDHGSIKYKPIVRS